MVDNYKLKKISEINQRTDFKVALVGKVLSTASNSFILDDGTGKAEIITEAVLEQGKIVRAFCSIVSEQLKADVIQDFNDFDLNLFMKIQNLYRKAGV